MTTAQKLENFFKPSGPWAEGVNVLRALILKTDLKEEIKWGMPVYTIDGENVVGIAAFKNHYGLWFYQGVFLKDKEGLLQNAQEGKTKAMRHLRFDSKTKPKAPLITNYVLEAIENAREGKKVKVVRKSTNVVLPQILKEALQENENLSEKFESLTQAKRRDYANYIAEAKQKATKIKRLERCVPLILKGKALSDLWTTS